MEILIGIGIGVVIAAIASGKKKNKEAPVQKESPQKRKVRETDELITVVLPTIDGDK